MPRIYSTVWLLTSAIEFCHMAMLSCMALFPIMDMETYVPRTTGIIAAIPSLQSNTRSSATMAKGSTLEPARSGWLWAMNSWVDSTESCMTLRILPVPSSSKAPGGRVSTWPTNAFFMFFDIRNAARCETISAAMYTRTEATAVPRAISPLNTMMSVVPSRASRTTSQMK